MSVTRIVGINLGTGVALAAHPIHFICTTTPELPSSGLKAGVDTAIALDTLIEYKASSPTTWTLRDASTSTVVPSQFRPKTADETVTSSVTLQDDNHMFLDLLANETWKFTIYNVWTGPGQFRIAWSVPAGTTMTWQDTLDSGTPAAVGDVLTDAGGGSAGIFRCEGVIWAAGTAGVARVRWAQSTSNATATTLKKGTLLAAVKAA